MGTAKTESQLIDDILSELDTLYGKFDEQNSDLATLVAATSALVTTLDTLIDTLSTTVGAGTAVSIAADIAVTQATLDAVGA